MTVFCVLHVDDDPDLREVVEASLRLSPEFVVQSCASSHEALAIVAQWLPDIGHPRPRTPLNHPRCPQFDANCSQSRQD
jgi:CheY-like chemotaxis protein